VKVGGVELTPEGRERIRTLVDGIISKMNEDRAKGKAAGELPDNATTPPGISG
jgi:hypothetical protein